MSRKAKNETTKEPENVAAADSGSRILKWVLIGLAAVCGVLVLFILVLDSTGSRQKKIRSEAFGYTILYDEARFEYETVRLDSSGSTMERFFLKDSQWSNYIGISKIDASIDFAEAIASLQPEESLQMEDLGEVTVGSGKYSARKAGYTDYSGDTPVRVEYYYIADRGVLVTTSADSSHKKELAAMLASLSFD